ncbi:MAG: hypothetical protein WCI12_07250 [Actinomycetes bacterium]
MFLVITILSWMFSMDLRHLGLTIAGDEPSYLVSGLAIGKFHTLDVTSAYAFAVHHHLFTTWTTPPIEPLWPSHGQKFPIHNLGLPLLLTVPARFANFTVAELGLSVIVGALTTWIVVLATGFSTARSPRRFLVAGVFLLPSFLVASTQFYPDLPSGLLFAVTVLLMAQMETTAKMTISSAAASSVIIGLLPWLHTQNLVLALLLLSGIAAITWHLRPPPKVLVALMAPMAVLWLLFVAYNLYIFSHPLGPPNDTVSFGLLSATRIVALLIDRQRGLISQFPFLVLGLTSVWLGRRRFPVTALVSIAAIVGLTCLSGSFAWSFGGTSLVGRFNWALLPLLGAFAAVYLLMLSQRSRLGTGFLVLAMICLYAVQAFLLFHGDHVFFDFASLGPGPLRSGWWGSAIDGLLPSFNGLEASWGAGAVWLRVALVVSVGSFALWLLCQPFRDRTQRSIGQGLVLGIISGALGVATIVSGPQLMAPITLKASHLSSVTGDKVHGARVVIGNHPGALAFGPGWSFNPGHYEIQIHYMARDPNPHAAPFDVVQQGRSPRGSVVTLGRGFLPTGTHSPWNISVIAPTSTPMFVRIFWTGSGSLTVDDITIWQVKS